jgi:8-oxo-dGTP pyrophosphatase MutT (NUDIX family)
MARKYAYEYPRPALTVDCVVFGLDEKDLKVLLIERAGDPFAGRWALPGGFVQVDETLDGANWKKKRGCTSGFWNNSTRSVPCAAILATVW